MSREVKGVLVNHHYVIKEIDEMVRTKISWLPDSGEVGWYVGEYASNLVFMRLGDFPSENIFSVWLGRGRWLELEEVPACWTVDSKSDHPTSARPSLEKGEFYDD
jgi:hypothetical protein